MMFPASDEFSPRLPTEKMVTLLRTTSVTLQWVLNSTFNSSRPETFVVSYGTKPGEFNTRSPAIPATPTSQTYSTQLTSLEPGTVYHYRIESMNNFESLFTDMMSFLTEDESELKPSHTHTHTHTHTIFH